MNTPRERATRAEVARRAGVTRAAIGKAIGTGRMTPPGDDGLLDVEQALAEFRRNRHPTVGGTQEAAPDGRGRSHRDRYWRARAAREEAEAALAEIKRREAERSTVSLRDHQQCLFAVGATVRNGVSGIPPRVAAVIAAAVRDDLAAAGASPELLAAVGVATAQGAERVLQAECRTVLLALKAAVGAMRPDEAARAAP